MFNLDVNLDIKYKFLPTLSLVQAHARTFQNQICNVFHLRLVESG